MSKAELLSRCWAGTAVCEAVVKTQLRRVLDDRANETVYIATVNRRGYCFVGPVRLRGPSQGDSTARSTKTFTALHHLHRLGAAATARW